MAKVWFIRHGESEANAGAISNDPAGIELTKQGRGQAEHISTLFDSAPNLIVASPFLRTQQTARPTMDRFPHVPYAIWPIQEFTYLSPGKCNGTTADQRRPMVMAYWEQCDPDYIDGVGAESFSQMLGRVADLIRFLQQSTHDFVVIFAHGQVMQATRLLSAESGHTDAEMMRLFHALERKTPIPNGKILRAHISSNGLIFDV